MAVVQQVNGDLVVTGYVQANGGFKAISRASLAQESLAVYPVPLWGFRKHDDRAVNLAATGASDDLGLYTGTFGTDAPKLSSGDVKAAGAVTRRGAITIAMPVEYQAGETVNIRISAATETTVADTSSTVDVEAYLVGRDGTIDGSDLCSTSATSINSTSFSNKSFTIDAATLTPGCEIDLRVSLISNDAATAGVVQPSIGAVELLCDIKG